MVQTNESELKQLKKDVKHTFQTKPKNEVEAVQLQQQQLEKIKVVADKLKSLR